LICTIPWNNFVPKRVDRACAKIACSRDPALRTKACRQCGGHDHQWQDRYRRAAPKTGSIRDRATPSRTNSTDQVAAPHVITACQTDRWHSTPNLHPLDQKPRWFALGGNAPSCTIIRSADQSAISGADLCLCVSKQHLFAPPGHSPQAQRLPTSTRPDPQQCAACRPGDKLPGSEHRPAISLASPPMGRGSIRHEDDSPRFKYPHVFLEESRQSQVSSSREG